MFLEDEGAVHKLVASQYKIAPDKLMRTGCFNGGKRSGKHWDGQLGIVVMIILAMIILPMRIFFHPLDTD